MLNNFIAPQEACKRKYLATDVRAQSGMLLSISVARMVRVVILPENTIDGVEQTRISLSLNSKGN